MSFSQITRELWTQSTAWMQHTAATTMTLAANTTAPYIARMQQAVEPIRVRGITLYTSATESFNELKTRIREGLGPYIPDQILQNEIENANLEAELARLQQELEQVIEEERETENLQEATNAIQTQREGVQVSQERLQVLQEQLNQLELLLNETGQAHVELNQLLEQVQTAEQEMIARQREADQAEVNRNQRVRQAEIQFQTAQLNLQSHSQQLTDAQAELQRALSAQQNAQNAFDRVFGERKENLKTEVNKRVGSANDYSTLLQRLHTEATTQKSRLESLKSTLELIRIEIEALECGFSAPHDDNAIQVLVNTIDNLGLSEEKTNLVNKKVAVENLATQNLSRITDNEKAQELEQKLQDLLPSINTALEKILSEIDRHEDLSNFLQARILDIAPRDDAMTCHHACKTTLNIPGYLLFGLFNSSAPAAISKIWSDDARLRQRLESDKQAIATFSTQNALNTYTSVRTQDINDSFN